MNRFSRRKQADPQSSLEPFDFAALDLPRVEPPSPAGFAGINVIGQTVPVRVTIYETLEHLADHIAPMNPFLLAAGASEPLALIRLEGLDQQEVNGFVQAVRAGRSLLLPYYRSMPTFPMLALSLAVYDRPGAPFVFEAFRDITVADVQDFLTALGRTGGRGTVHLYGEGSDGNVTRLAEGSFALRLSPAPDAWVSYATKAADLKKLWQVIIVGASWLRSIPPESRDFDAAVSAYIAQEG